MHICVLQFFFSLLILFAFNTRSSTTKTHNHKFLCCFVWPLRTIFFVVKLRIEKVQQKCFVFLFGCIIFAISRSSRINQKLVCDILHIVVVINVCWQVLRVIILPFLSRSSLFINPIHNVGFLFIKFFSICCVLGIFFVLFALSLFAINIKSQVYTLGSKNNTKKQSKRSLLKDIVLLCCFVARSIAILYSAQLVPFFCVIEVIFCFFCSVSHKNMCVISSGRLKILKSGSTLIYIRSMCLCVFTLNEVQSLKGQVFSFCQTAAYEIHPNSRKLFKTENT